jgi:hypothetical protein
MYSTCTVQYLQPDRQKNYMTHKQTSDNHDSKTGKMLCTTYTDNYKYIGRLTDRQSRFLNRQTGRVASKPTEKKLVGTDVELYWSVRTDFLVPGTRQKKPAVFFSKVFMHVSLNSVEVLSCQLNMLWC